MTMSYDLFNSGLKRLKTPCIIMLFILWFFAYHVKFCFLRFRNINELFNTEGRYCTHTLRSIYFSKWFSHWQVISGLQMCLYFCFKTPLSKIYFYSFFYAKPLIKFVQHPTILWLEVSVTYSSWNIRKTVRILMFKSKIHQKFLMFQR